MDTSLSALVTADPGLPHPNPTVPYWISIPHDLAQTQSPVIPDTADVVIIGSGMTGTSTALHLLEKQNDTQVAVLDARSLCSGATGRNGGHLITYGATMYSFAKERLGQEMAHKLISFTFKNVDEVANAAQQYAPETSEYRTVERVRCFANQQEYDEAKSSVAEFEKDYPAESGKYKFITAETALQEHGVHNVAGVVLFPAAAIWPYRFIMDTWETLLKKYPHRLSIDAETPVTGVTLGSGSGDGKYKYQVQTSRGIIQAAHVVYATNAYSGHLLPGIRGLMYPFQSNMTVQDLNHEVPNRGNINSWSIHRKAQNDPVTKRTQTETLYLQQNAKSGYFFFGGENSTAEETLTSDDSKIRPESTDYLKFKLAKFFGQQNPEKNGLVSEWNGIQGHTADKIPIVGPLPQSITNREGNGEWIGAGFNGGGMAFCWMVGKSLAAMINGEDVSDWFPECLYLSQQRLTSSLTTEAAIEYNAEYFPGHQVGRS